MFWNEAQYEVLTAEVHGRFVLLFIYAERLNSIKTST